MNYANNKEKNYDLNAIGPQLDKLRRYFRYSQTDIAKLLGVSKQYWGGIEKNKAVLNTKKLVQVAKMFKIDINYFLLSDVDIKDFLFFPINQQIAFLPKKPDKKKDFFIETSIFKTILDIVKSTKLGQITLLQTISGNGTTTALKKITTQINKNVLIINNMQIVQKILNDIENLKDMQALQNFAFIVIEDVENYPSPAIIKIIDFFKYNNTNIIITSKQANYFEQYFSQFIFLSYYLLPLTIEDVLIFLRSEIPDFNIPQETLYKLQIKIHGDINILLNTITQLKQQKE